MSTAIPCARKRYPALAAADLKAVMPDFLPWVAELYLRHLPDQSRSQERIRRIRAHSGAQAAGSLAFVFIPLPECSCEIEQKLIELLHA